jgi:hypothetical protein
MLQRCVPADNGRFQVAEVIRSLKLEDVYGAPENGRRIKAAIPGPPNTGKVLVPDVERN